MRMNEIAKKLELHKKWLDSKCAHGEKAKFDGKDLKTICFSNINLEGVSIERSNLKSSTFVNTNLKCSSLFQSDFIAADLNGANLRSANLSCTSFYMANLRNADMRNSNLYGIDLRYSDLTNTKMDVDISEGLVLITFGRYIFLKGRDFIKIGCVKKTLNEWKTVTKEHALELGLYRESYEFFKRCLNLPLVKWW